MVLYGEGLLKLIGLASGIGVSLLLLNFALRCFYNLFIHPLRKYPGPSLLAASRLPLSYWTLTGQAPRKVLVLHQKYGDVVRIAPDQLAYANAAGWKDVYGHRPGHATSQLPKDLTAFPPTPPGLAKGIITADDAEHSRFRRLLSHAFSARALEQQEGLILGYIKQLVQGLSEECHRGPQNILAWYNWTTFDLIGDLAFGEPFGCLVRREYHPWIKTILDNIKIGLAMSCIRNYPHLAALMPYLIPKSVAKKRLEHSSMTEAKVERRLEKGVTDKPDDTEQFMTFILKNQGTEKELTLPEIIPNASTLVLAGSETTATLLAGATYLLCINPPIMEKLVHEIRSSFRTAEEINMENVSRLVYTMAVLKEALRVYPPVPTALCRVVTDPAGDVIAGQWVPPNTRVGVYQWATSHSPANFTKPDSFLPERWLDTDDPHSAFANDRRDAVQPFSTGPRNCIGQNLAYMEMRLILAHVLYRFDLALVPSPPGAPGWIDGQKMLGLWEKVPLMVTVTERERG